MLCTLCNAGYYAAQRGFYTVDAWTYCRCVTYMWCLSCHPPRCACGQLTAQHAAIPPGANSVEEAHQLVQIDTQKDKWSVIKHTRTYPTDAFGVIEFQGGGFVNKAMVRLICVVYRKHKAGTGMRLVTALYFSPRFPLVVHSRQL